MTFCLVTDRLSPHEMPLAESLAEFLGTGNFWYIVRETTESGRKQLGWSVDDHSWCLVIGDSDERNEIATRLIKTAEVALFGNRMHPLLAWRVHNNKLTFYGSERWFKPPIGFLRMVHPQCIRLLIRFNQLYRRSSFFYLAQGVHAATDMKRLGCPSHRIRRFGYFVEASVPMAVPSPRSGPLCILWGGRMVQFKRVDTLIKAVGRLASQDLRLKLTLVGHGPKERELKQLAESLDRQAELRFLNSSRRGKRAEASSVSFLPAVPMADMRQLMRQAHVYVLPSDGYEGWGVVVNEAMLEGCAVVASRDGGAAATMIQHGENGMLFSSGNVKELSGVLQQLYENDTFRIQLAVAGQSTVMREWAPSTAAERLLGFSEDWLSGLAPRSWEQGPMSNI